MVEHQSKEVVDKMSNELKVQPALLLPREIAKNIQPVYNVNPIKHVEFIGRALKSTTGSTTIHTNHATKDTFITGVCLTWDIDATSDIVELNIQGTIASTDVSFVLLAIAKLTTTANQGVLYKTFNPPIKMAKGTIIRASTTQAAGAFNSHAWVSGYETDPQ